MIWTNKYAPKTLRDVRGNTDSLLELEDFILNYKSQKKNSLLLHGLPGVGKTSSVYAIAKEHNLEILEINASDIRNKDGINSVLGNSVNQASLFNRGKIILVDEVDGLSGTKDRGGVPAIVAIVAKSPFPVILTANDAYLKKLSPIRKKSKVIELLKLSYIEIFEVLKNICSAEEITSEESILKKISMISSGDLRSAINDLQTVASGKKELNSEDLEILGYREKKEEIDTALNLIFKSKSEQVIYALNEINMNLDESLLWIEENLPSVYADSKDLGLAFESISLADVFRGRIRRMQHWRFLVYQNYFMTAGVSFVKENKSNTFHNYKRSSRILKLWIAKMKYGKKRALAEKIAEESHISKKRAFESLGYLKYALENDIELRNELKIDDGDLKGLV
jgi:replication factor C large subunit